MRNKILIIGSLNTDMVINLQTMPKTGETVMGGGFKYVQGGKGANQALAAAKLGGAVSMLGCVGADDFGKIQRENLSCWGVDVSRIKIDPELPTGTAVIYVDQNGDNSIVVIQGANAGCSAEYLKAQDDSFKACDIVVLQMEIPFEAVSYAVDRARELGKTVILNPAPMSYPLPDSLLTKLNYITPNETELQKLTGMDGETVDELGESAMRMAERIAGSVIVTIGEKGALYAGKDGMKIYPTRKVEAVDTTAAGDCFNGALAVALSEGKRIDEAVMFANIAASIAITRSGAQTSMPQISEIRALMPDNITYESEGKI